MNLEELKSGFRQYQEKQAREQSRITGEYKEAKSDNIFLSSNDFKDYLIDECGFDSSIFSKSLNEIIENITKADEESKKEDEEILDAIDSEANAQEDIPQEFEEGQYEYFEDEIELQDSEDIEQEPQIEPEEEFGEDDFILEVLNQAFEDEKVISELDSDKDGELSVDEKSDFLFRIGGEENNLDFDGIAKGVQSIYDGNYEEQFLSNSGNKNILNRLLDKVYADENVIKVLDEDKDGIISDEEKAKFEEYIKGYEGEGDELSEADIKRAYDDILNGDFAYENNPDELSKQKDETIKIAADKAKEQEEKLKTAADTSSQGSSGSASGSSGANYSGSYGSGSGTSAYSGNSFSNSSIGTSQEPQALSLEQLEEKKQQKEGELQQAQQDLRGVYSGENEAISAAQADMELKEEEYNNALEEDENVSKELKEQIQQNLLDINEKEDLISQTQADISDKESQITSMNAQISAEESNLEALNSALSSLKSLNTDDEEKKAQIQEKINSAEEQIRQAEAAIKTHKEELAQIEEQKTGLEKTLKEAKESLEALKTTKAELEQQLQETCSEDTKQKLEAFNSARDNIEKVKAQELEKAQKAQSEVSKELDEINAQINEKKAEETISENTIGVYDFNFDTNLTDSQKNELETIKKIFEENKELYEEVAKRTGVPAELIAAIHYREGSCNFGTYLHNGEKLGKTTTLVPKGVYFDNWTDAAVDALNNYGGNKSKIDPNNTDTWFEYAEAYNGYGYRNKGLASPYVWSGTTKYTGGMYVADGVFSASAKDQRVGVAVIVQSLLS